jgi:hypothetical protein
MLAPLSCSTIAVIQRKTALPPPLAWVAGLTVAFGTGRLCRPEHQGSLIPCEDVARSDTLQAVTGASDRGIRTPPARGQTASSCSDGPY